MALYARCRANFLVLRYTESCVLTANFFFLFSSDNMVSVVVLRLLGVWRRDVRKLGFSEVVRMGIHHTTSEDINSGFYKKMLWFRFSAFDDIFIFSLVQF